MARSIDTGDRSVLGDEDARRQAILRRLAQGGQAGGSVLERAGVDVPTTPFTPTVAGAASPSEAARDSRSVLERNEQSTMGPFQSQAEDGEQRRARLFSQATRGFDVQAELARISAQQAQRIGETQPPSQQAKRDQRIGETVTPRESGAIIRPLTPYEQSRQQVANIPVLGGITNAISGVSNFLTGAPSGGHTLDSLRRQGPIPPFVPIGPVGAIGANNSLTNAIFRKIGRVPGLAPAARNAGPEAAEQAGRWATQDTPLRREILTRLGRIPTPVKVAAGAGAVAGGAALAGLVPGQGATPDQNSEVRQKEGQNGPQSGPPQRPVRDATDLLPIVSPGTQRSQTTLPGEPRASVNPIMEPPRGTYTPVPQFGTTPRVAAPVTGTPLVGRPPVTPGTPPLTPPGNQRVTLPPFIDEGRRPLAGPPPGVTPGQTPTGPTTGPLPEGPLNSDAMRQQVVADLNGIAQIINAGPMAPDVMAIFASQGSKLLELIAEQEKTLRAQAESEGRTIDPATQNTLDVLREQLGLQLKQTRETLNSRGILDSGILIEAEQMLRKGNLQGQAAILAERLSRIQNNLNQGLGQFRQQRIQGASQFGMAGAQAQTQAELAERKRLDDLRQTLVQGRMSLGAQYANEEQKELDRQLAIAQQQAELAARSGDREMELAARAREEELNRQFQRQQLDREIDAGKYTFSPAQQAAAGGFSADATNEMLSTLRAHLAAGGSLEDALASFQAHSAYWASRGADTNRVSAWLQQQGGR